MDVTLVGATGFEPATTSTPRRCATGLRYAPTGIWRGPASGPCYTTGAVSDKTPPARRYRGRARFAPSVFSMASSVSMSFLSARIVSSRSSFVNGSSI